MTETPFVAPTRTNYFVGRLLDAADMQREQHYGNEKRWLINKLALGSGVLCGLGVTVGADGKLCIAPGVAIDGCGREIVVPTALAPIDPATPTDDEGGAVGGELAEGPSTIYLCYAEHGANPVVGGAASITVEGYRILVRSGLPAARPAALLPEQVGAIFPQTPPSDFDRRRTTYEALAVSCPEPLDRAGVVLATVTWSPADPQRRVDPYTHRAEVFSNTMLFQLIAALAERVDACCAAVHPA